MLAASKLTEQNMKKRFFKTKRPVAILLSIIAGLIMFGWYYVARCPKPQGPLQIASAFKIIRLNPWPGAKIPFTCQTVAFLKSPFAPRMIRYTEQVYREEGFPILGGKKSQYLPREGAVLAIIPVEGELQEHFPEPIEWEMPPVAQAVSLYVDGKELKIGHIGYDEFDSKVLIFATILDPFLWPGGHTGKIIIQLPNEETLEYEWLFEITWL